MRSCLYSLVTATVLFSSCGSGESAGDNANGQKIKFKFSIDTVNSKEDVVPGRITAEPAFDGVFYKVTASVEHGTLVALWFTGNVAYTANGRNDNLAVERALDVSGYQEIYWKFPELRGNLLTATIHAKARNNYTGQIEYFSQGAGSRSIYAVQPGKDSIRKYLGSPDLAVVVYHLSRFQKFDKDGQPLYAEGFGLFKRRDLTAEEIWHWKKDADRGKADWQRRYDETKLIPKKLRDSDPEKYKKLPDLTPDELLLETFQTYGSGRALEPVQKGIIKHWEWQEIANSDGTGRKMMNIKREVAAGNFPDGWK